MRLPRTAIDSGGEVESLLSGRLDLAAAFDQRSRTMSRVPRQKQAIPRRETGDALAVVQLDRNAGVEHATTSVSCPERMALIRSRSGVFRCLFRLVRNREGFRCSARDVPVSPPVNAGLLVLAAAGQYQLQLLRGFAAGQRQAARLPQAADLTTIR